jgi:hypothetical protein
VGMPTSSWACHPATRRRYSSNSMMIGGTAKTFPPRSEKVSVPDPPWNEAVAKNVESCTSTVSSPEPVSTAVIPRTLSEERTTRLVPSPVVIVTSRPMMLESMLTMLLAKAPVFQNPATSQMLSAYDPHTGVRLPY